MTEPYPTTPCTYCGRPIVWGVDGNGKRIPLDPRPPVYRVFHPQAGGRTCTLARDTSAMVSHFATCPRASEASGRARQPQRDPIQGRATSATPPPTSYGEPQGEAAQDALREVDL